MTTQSDAILSSLDQAIRAGFSVEFRPCSDSVEVHIKPVSIVSGTASDRVEPFTIIRPNLRDAAANALQAVGLEIDQDRESKR